MHFGQVRFVARSPSYCYRIRGLAPPGTGISRWLQRFHPELSGLAAVGESRWGTVLVFSQLVWRPSSDASSSKNDSAEVRVSYTSASRATSSAKSKSEQAATPIEEHRWVPETVRPRILSMATLKASGARMHPCRTPVFTSNHWLSSPHTGHNWPSRYIAHETIGWAWVGCQ